jgi:hypothetical protein
LCGAGFYASQRLFQSPLHKKSAGQRHSQSANLPTSHYSS